MDKEILPVELYPAGRTVDGGDGTNLDCHTIVASKVTGDRFCEQLRDEAEWSLQKRSNGI